MPIALSDRLAVMARHIVNNMEIEPIKKPTMNHNADILSLPILIYGTKELRPNHITAGAFLEVNPMGESFSRISLRQHEYYHKAAS